MTIRIAPPYAEEFRFLYQTEEFTSEERNYKWAVHLLVRGLLSEEILDSDRFPELLRALMNGELKPADVNLDTKATEAVDDEFSIPNDQYQVLANLCGGRWGTVQLERISVAIDFELGEDFRASFRNLVDEESPLSSRIDEFRDALQDIQIELRDRGGFKPKWTVIKPSYAFVGMILGAFDPRQYTFYHATNLRLALEVLGAVWPTVNGGQKYAAVCELVREAHEAFRTSDIPVRDLIDTQ